LHAFIHHWTKWTAASEVLYAPLKESSSIIIIIIIQIAISNTYFEFWGPNEYQWDYVQVSIEIKNRL
jgi:hypothetical protein